MAEDSALKPFKSYNNSVKQLRRIGDVLTVVVVAGMVSFNLAFDQTALGLVCFVVICDRKSKYFDVDK